MGLFEADLQDPLRGQPLRKNRHTVAREPCTAGNDGL